MSNMSWPVNFRIIASKSQYRQQARIFRGHRNSQQNGNAYVASHPRQSFISKNHAVRQFESLDRLRQENRFCDINIVVQGKRFPAHWVVLAAASPYFEAMYRMNLMETQTNVATLHEIENPEVFQIILDFIYKGDIEVREENCQFLLAAANMLQLPEVVGFCCTFLSKHLHPSNCVGIFRFAELHACTNLKLDAKRLIECKFTEVMKEDEFLHIPQTTLQAFLRSEGLSIDNECQVFDALMTWILHDVNARRRYIFDLLPDVRIAVMSNRMIEQYLERCPDAKLREDIRAILDDYRLQLKLARQDESRFDVRLQPRMCARKSVYIIGGTHLGKNQRHGDDSALQRVERLDLFRGVWTQEAKMPSPKACHGTAVLDNLIYVVGGDQNGLILADADLFDPVTREWQALTPLHQPRTMHGLCSADGALFAIGGIIEAGLTDSIERYDPMVDNWILLDHSLSNARAAMGVVSRRGLIYIVGGMVDNHRMVNTVEVYNPTTGVVSQLAAMKNPRSNMGIAVLHDHIYVVGGNGVRGPLSSVERYSIDENTWCEIVPLKRARFGCSASAVDNTLYVIGGRVPSTDSTYADNTLDTVQVYDPELNRWMDSNNTLPISRCDAGIVVM
ncbi:actin-binding protein IPP-like [Tropilaelaps mercedesae]|uniref:Kelch-like protein diablo n=1 Tax=Tropilaelaps mercedesae TaxID=418985 RepID=A0A1V9XUH2_9ACAR|nr:actin-binding protein IPP-like [Tropilaelaps mercedesae]